MYCSECGNKLNDNDLFCSNCGTKRKSNPFSNPINDNLIDSQQRQNTAPSSFSQTKNNSNYSQKSNKGCLSKFVKWSAISVGIIFLLALILILMPSKLDTEEFMIGLSTQEQEFTTSNGIKVTVPPFLLKEDTKLEIGQKDSSEEETLKVVDVTLGDYHKFDSLLEISIPIDTSKVESMETLKVLSVNPETGKMEPLLTDIKNNNIVVYTDHLSEFFVRFDKTKNDSKIITYHKYKESEIPFVKNLRKKDITSFSKEQMESFIKNKASEKESPEMAEAMFNNACESVGWAGNASTFAQQLYQSDALDQYLHGNLSTMGNMLFYISAARDFNTGLQTGNFDPLYKTLANQITSMSAGYLGGPANLLYVSSQITLYFGEKVYNYAHETVNEDYMKAFDILYEEKLKRDYPSQTIKQRKYDMCYEWYNDIKKIAQNSKSKEDFQKSIDKMVRDEVLKIYNDGDLDIIARKIKDEKLAEATNIDRVLLLFDTSTENYDLRERLIKEKSRKLLLDLKPAFEQVSRDMIRKQELGYYKAYNNIRDKLKKQYNLTFKIDGPLSKGMTTMFELRKDDKIALKAKNSDNKPVTFKYMSFATYMSLDSPDKAILIATDADGNKYTKEKPFGFKLSDQEIVFNIDQLNKLEDTSPDTNKSNNQISENTPVDLDNYVGTWSIGLGSIAKEKDINWDYIEPYLKDKADIEVVTREISIRDTFELYKDDSGNITIRHDDMTDCTIDEETNVITFIGSYGHIVPNFYLEQELDLVDRTVYEGELIIKDGLFQIKGSVKAYKGDILLYKGKFVATKQSGPGVNEELLF